MILSSPSGGDFPNPIHNTWLQGALAALTGSEHMIWEFNKKWEQDYLIKVAETLQAVTDRRNAALENNTTRVCDSHTAANLACRHRQISAG